MPTLMNVYAHVTSTLMKRIVSTLQEFSLSPLPPQPRQPRPELSP